MEEGVLAQILEAGLYAPSAGGGQRPLFVVCQNRELNLLLGKNKRPTPSPAWPRAASMSPKSSPALPTTPASPTPFTARPQSSPLFGPKGFLFTPEDCAVAAENMMLAADALGVGSCYIGQGWTAFGGGRRAASFAEVGHPPGLLRGDAAAVGLPPGRRPPSRPQAPKGGAGPPGVKSRKIF